MSASSQGSFMVGVRGHSVPVPPLPSRGSGRWGGKKKLLLLLLLAVGVSVVCPTSERAARPRDHPSFLFNPRLHALLLLLVQVTGKAMRLPRGLFSLFSVCFSEFFCSRPDRFTTGRRQTSSLSLSLSQYKHSLSLPPLSLCTHSQALSLSPPPLR